MDGDQRREIEADIRDIEGLLEGGFGFEDDLGPDGLTDNTEARREHLRATLRRLRERLKRLLDEP